MGRVGSIVGPLVGGVLLAGQWSTGAVFLTAAGAALCAALAAFGRLKRDAPPSYKYSRAMATRSEALIQALRADLEAAVASYADAIHEGEGTGEPGLEVRPRGTLASLLPPMRGEREAWKPLYAAFRVLPRYGDSPG